MDLLIKKSQLKGIITIPPSKSYTHRALICASLCKGLSVIDNCLICEDTLETITTLRALGAKISINQRKIEVDGTDFFNKADKLNFNYSGTTFRMLYPLIYYFDLCSNIFLSDTLKRRIDEEEIKEIENNIRNNDICLSSDKSSQFISGVLILLPFINSTLTINNDQSPYLEMTRLVMSVFNINVVKKYKTYYVDNSKYRNTNLIIENDYSNGALWISLSIFNKGLIVDGLNYLSIQGDYKIISYLEKMGVSFIKDNHTIQTDKVSFVDTYLSLENSLDLTPILASVASLSGKRVVIGNLSKLKYKESNRLTSIYEVLSKLGFMVSINEDKLIFNGRIKKDNDKIISSYQDHRIIMMLIVMASQIDNIIVKDFEFINKSYPNLLDDYRNLGGEYQIL